MSRSYSLSSQVVSALLLASLLPTNLAIAGGPTVRPYCVDLAKLVITETKIAGTTQTSSSSSSAKSSLGRRTVAGSISSKSAIVNVGVTIKYNSNVYYISSVTPGSAAEKSGLLPGDEIRQIGGQPVGSRYSAQSMVDALNGPEGTSVKLEIGRQKDGGFPVITLVRTKQVTMSDFETKTDNGFAYVRIRAFTPAVASAVRTWSKTTDVQKAKGVILDVRTNPDGDVTSLMAIFSPFVPKGTSFGTVLTQSTSRPLKTTDAPSLPAGVPVAIIVNEGGMQGAVVRYGMYIKRVPAAVVVVEGQSVGKNSVIPGGFTFAGVTGKEQALQYCAENATFTWDLLYKGDVTAPPQPGKDTALEKAEQLLQNVR